MKVLLLACLVLMAMGYYSTYNNLYGAGHTVPITPLTPALTGTQCDVFPEYTIKPGCDSFCYWHTYCNNVPITVLCNDAPQKCGTCPECVLY